MNRKKRSVDRRGDVVEEIIAERTRRNPEFPSLMAAAAERRSLLRALGTERQRVGLTQTEVAARMDTSQAAVARLERGEIDPRLSTIQRFATALGRTVRWEVVPARQKSRSG